MMNDDHTQGLPHRPVVADFYKWGGPRTPGHNVPQLGCAYACSMACAQNPSQNIALNVNSSTPITPAVPGRVRPMRALIDLPGSEYPKRFKKRMKEEDWAALLSALPGDVQDKIRG